MNSIAVRVEQLRRVNGWSQAELARRSGVSQAVISRLENGVTRSVSFRNLELLAHAMDCDPGYLIVSERSRHWRIDRRTGVGVQRRSGS